MIQTIRTMTAIALLALAACKTHQPPVKPAEVSKNPVPVQR